MKTLSTHFSPGSRRLAFDSELKDLATYHLHGRETVDPVHHIRISGEVDLETFELSEVTPFAMILPYGECRLAMARVRELNGLRLGRGYRDSVIKIMGRTRGCSHFMTLALELTQLQPLISYSGTRSRLPGKSRSDPEWLQDVRSLENACFGLRSDSPVINLGYPRASRDQ